MQLENKSIIVLLSIEQEKQLLSLNIPVKRIIRHQTEKDEGIAKIYNQPWNIDHFGPYTVPPGHYFVLGDNRHRSQDSRYTGPVPISDLVGKVVAHW
jgi:signal peptidase I